MPGMYNYNIILIWNDHQRQRKCTNAINIDIVIVCVIRTYFEIYVSLMLNVLQFEEHMCHLGQLFFLLGGVVRGEPVASPLARTDHPPSRRQANIYWYY